jgi:aminoglycoside/choline kinase family phosphotransferase
MTPEFRQLKSTFVDVFDARASAGVMTLAGELSSRSYYRIYFDNKEFPSAQSSYVLQQAEVFGKKSQHPFVLGQKIFASLGIKVPKIYGQDGKRGWILLEDCGDSFLQFRQELFMYRQAIAMLLALQSCLGPEDIRIPQDLKEAPHWSWSFDYEKLNTEMLHSEKYFARLLLGEDLPLAELCSENNFYLSQRPRVLCHRDFHSRNILVKNEELYAIDFQDARMGPVSYDLVSLLWDPYAYLKDSFRDFLLKEWRVSLNEKRFPDLETEIERMKIQRLIKAIGSYSSFFLEKKNPSCLYYIECALADVLTALHVLEKKKLLSSKEARLNDWLKKVYARIRIK